MRKDTIINDINIAVDEEGSGPVVILLHGIKSTKELMYMLRDELSDTFKVVCYDARGYGESTKVESISIEDHAKDLISLAGSYGSDISVVGFSMGSYIALLAAEMQPELFKKIVLIGTRGKVSGSSIERLLKEKGVNMDLLPQEEKVSVFQNLLFAPMTPHEKRKREKKYAEISPMTEDEKRIATDAIKNFDLFTNIRKVSAEVLCLTGEYDEVNPPEFGAQVADRLPKGRFETIKNAGHMVIMENLKDLSNAIMAFFKEK